jgi:hypothetical protein
VYLKLCNLGEARENGEDVGNSVERVVRKTKGAEVAVTGRVDGAFEVDVKAVGVEDLG